MSASSDPGREYRRAVARRAVASATSFDSKSWLLWPLVVRQELATGNPSALASAVRELMTDFARRPAARLDDAEFEAALARTRPTAYSVGVMVCPSAHVAALDFGRQLVMTMWAMSDPLGYRRWCEGEPAEPPAAERVTASAAGVLSLLDRMMPTRDAILAEVEVEAAKAIGPEPTRPAETPPPAAPVWNSETGTLSYNGRQKKYGRAVQVRKLLDTFQRYGWREWVGDPFQDASTSKNTVKSANKNGLIRFEKDRTGEGIRWSPAA